jgi:hypothetical protein
MKDEAAHESRRKANAGNEDYRHFHDQERAQQVVAMFLKTTAALSSRDALIEYLINLKQAFKAGERDDKSVFNAKTYRRAARAFINDEITRFQAF